MKKSLFEILVAFNLYIGGLKLHKANDRTKEKCQTIPRAYSNTLERPFIQDNEQCPQRVLTENEDFSVTTLEMLENKLYMDQSIW